FRRRVDSDPRGIAGSPYFTARSRAGPAALDRAGLTGRDLRPHPTDLGTGRLLRLDRSRDRALSQFVGRPRPARLGPPSHGRRFALGSRAKSCADLARNASTKAPPEAGG